MELYSTILFLTENMRQVQKNPEIAESITTEITYKNREWRRMCQEQEQVILLAIFMPAAARNGYG